MEKYYYIYKDSTGNWNTTTNPMFIASHKYCRAIPKYVVSDYMKYELISDMLYDLNTDKIHCKSMQFLIDYDVV